jgi:AAHS family 4-hydroxybenzoate transporter-like MFS transporter
MSRAVAAPSPLIGVSIRVAVLCGLVQVLDGYDLGTIGLAVPSLVRAWSLKPAAFTQAFAFSSIGIMLGAMIAGPIADRFGRKPMLLLSMALFGVFSILTAYSETMTQLVALRFLTGIGIGGAMPTTVALTSDYTAERWRASFVMFMFTGNTLGGFFAGQIAALVLPGWGWPGIFMVGGLVPLALLPLVWLALPEAPHLGKGSPAAAGNPLGALFRDGLALSTPLIWLIFLLSLLNMYLIFYWLPSVLNLGGMTPSEAAFATSIYSAGAVLSTLVLGPLIARFGAEQVLTVNMTLGVACIAVLTLAAPPPLLALAVLFVAGGGFVGSQLGLNGFAAAVYPADRRSTGVGWALGVGRLGGILGPVVGGLLLSFGFPPGRIMLFVCVPGLICAGLIMFLKAHRGRQVAPDLDPGVAMPRVDAES